LKKKNNKKFSRLKPDSPQSSTKATTNMKATIKFPTTKTMLKGSKKMTKMSDHQILFANSFCFELT
jgi:hypothetical protein